jgi:phosphoribosyl 1,2-cyclic phosphate phosphodiesterase
MLAHREGLRPYGDFVRLSQDGWRSNGLPFFAPGVGANARGLALRARRDQEAIEMELIFLGTGTSQGVPMIAQRKDAPIDLRNPKNWRTRTSAHIVMGGLHIQIDAAQELRLQCIREEIPAVDLFILTHGHADHILGMDDLRRYCDLRKGEALPVYGTQEGLERVRSVFPYAVRERPLASGYPAFSLHQMPPRLELEGGSVQSVLLPHGPVQTLGLVFTEASSGSRIAYFTDCLAVTDEAVEISRGADVAVLDALRPRPHPTHMNTQEAIAAAGAIGAKRTFFTHMTYEVDHETDGKALPEGVHYAYDGLRVQV